MEDLAFFNDEERSEYSDELYSVVGRALTVATHYDMNCKVLANTFSIREKRHLLDDKNAFNELLENLSKRQLKPSIDTFTSRIKKALKQGGISSGIIAAIESSIFQYLQDGRAARNYIAHDLAAELSQRIDQESFREGFLKETRECIKKIVKADFYISVFIENHINKSQVQPSLEAYIDNVCNWVCDIDV